MGASLLPRRGVWASLHEAIKTRIVKKWYKCSIFAIYGIIKAELRHASGQKAVSKLTEPI